MLHHRAAEKEHAHSNEFRRFHRQLFHTSLAQILSSLKPWMSVPEVVKCADGLYQRVIYGLGPYIADYPEQVLLAGIVQGWCPKWVFFSALTSFTQPGSLKRCRCTTPANDLKSVKGVLRSGSHSDDVKDLLGMAECWTLYGMVSSIEVGYSH